MHLRTTVWPTWLGAAAMVSVLWACRPEKPDDEAPAHTTEAAHVAEPDTHQESIAQACELERQRFVLLDGHWQSECLDTPIPRTSSIWTSDGHRVAVLVNEKCEDTEEQKVLIVEKDAVKQVPLRVERRVGRGGAIALQDDDVVIVPGESCRVPARGLLIHRMNLETGIVQTMRHFDSMATLWPSLSLREGHVNTPLAFSDSFGLVDRANFGIDYGCIHIWPVRKEYAGCRTPSPYYPPDEDDGEIAWGSTILRKTNKGGAAYPVGRGLTWAQDRSIGFMLYVGGIDAPGLDGLNAFTLAPFAWALDEYRMPRRIPIPPVMGDGVQLVYDADHKQMVLLDPASVHSWKLNHYRRWVPFEHEPLAVLADQLAELESVPLPREVSDLRTPPTRAELDAVLPPIWRNTDHLAPWFAAYDLDRHTIVVYPYRPEGVFCLPVGDDTSETVCLASHS